MGNLSQDVSSFVNSNTFVSIWSGSRYSVQEKAAVFAQFTWKQEVHVQVQEGCMLQNDYAKLKLKKNSNKGV